MTPEERKAIAMRNQAPSPKLCQRHYPKCCNYHQGFDDALALLERVGVTLEPRRPTYAIEAAP